jgi:hypothetical protein
MERNLLVGSALSIAGSGFPEVWNSIPELLNVVKM